MATTCITKQAAANLKIAFKDKVITLDMLQKMDSSAKRVETLSKYVGESAKLLNASLEKTFISPNQKLAMRNWIFKNIAQAKPLYVGISLDQSAEMAKNLKMTELKRMDDTQRIAELSKYVDTKTAEQLNKRFTALTKTGNLQNFEERTLGTKELRENKKLKGSLAKLETLNDLGVLNPKQVEKFMQSFVETELNVDITMEESQQLSKLIKEQQGLFDSLIESGDLTYTNEKMLTEYLAKNKEIREFEEGLQPKTFTNTANKIIAYMRSVLLFRLNSIKNSGLYQIIPSAERYLAKRIVSGSLGAKEVTFLEDLQSRFIKVKMPTELKKFIKGQTLMGIRIYHKTGFDLSRMQTFDDGYNVFAGEKFQAQYGNKKISEAQTKREGVKIALNNWAKFVNLGPKWAAGGTDTIIANFARADTAIVKAKQKVRIEKMKGTIPAGMTEEQRILQLVKDSYLLDPKGYAADIKAFAILDAHMSNNTQKEGMSDWITGVRDKMNIKNVAIGKAIIPFLKITTTTISRGIKSASGYDIAKGIFEINRASKETNINERNKKMYIATTGLVSTVGIMGAAILLALFLDDDDYIGEYDLLSSKEYALGKGRGAGAGYVRIGGKWIPIKYLPMINIPLSSIMTARQSIGRGDSVDNVAYNYVRGIITGVLSTPGISNIKKILDAGADANKNKELAKALDRAGLDGEDVMSWAWARALPAVISYEAWNLLNPPEAKYDFLGRPIEKNMWKFWRNDESNEITLEFSRLNGAGFMPTVTDPKDVDSKKLQELKKNYADKVSMLINRSGYQRKSDEDKKKKIDALRKKYILDKK